MVGAYVQFVRNLEALGVRKRGRHPVFNANQFYPFAAERELEEITRAELLRSLEENIAIALRGERFGDSLEELLANPSELPKDFKGRLPKVTAAVSAKVSADFARQSEMTIGQPYYPPAAKEDIFKTWEQNFQQLCISAESDAKKEISQIVAEGKQKGWNGDQVEKAIRSKLPDSTMHRAELIARTEMGKLNSAARLAQFKEIGIEYYKWMTTIDGRERDSHKRMNGKICSVSDPSVYFVETPDGLEKRIRIPGAMFIGNPGEDFQCRCSMVSWCPEIDGKYEVKEAPEPEPKEPSKLEVAREETKKEKARAEKAETELKKTNRSLEIMKSARERHEQRSPEETETIQQKWLNRNAKREPVFYKNSRIEGESKTTPTDVLDISEFEGRIKKIEKSVKSIKGVAETTSYGSADLNGNIHINFAVDENGFNAGVSLASAFFKIKNGGKLDQMEEYSIEIVQHEILHTKSKNKTVLPKLNDPMNGYLRMHLETVNQLVARYEYPKLLKKIGKEAEHSKWVIEDGFGYNGTVANLRLLLKTAKIDEEKFVQNAKQLLMNDYAGFEYEIKKIIASLYKGKGDILRAFDFLEVNFYNEILNSLKISP